MRGGVGVTVSTEYDPVRCKMCIDNGARLMSRGGDVGWTGETLGRELFTAGPLRKQACDCFKFFFERPYTVKVCLTPLNSARTL